MIYKTLEYIVMFFIEIIKKIVLLIVGVLNLILNFIKKNINYITCIFISFITIYLILKILIVSEVINNFNLL